MGNSFNESIDVLFGRMEEFVSTKTVVGEAVTVGGVTLLPLIEVSVGVGAGGGNNAKAQNMGGGLGAKIVPSAILVITGDNVRLVNIKNQDALSKLIDLAPDALNKLNFFSKKEEAPKEEIKFEEKIVVEE